MKNIFKRTICIIMLMAMLLTAFPFTAFAGGDDGPSRDADYGYVDTSSGSAGANAKFFNDGKNYILQMTMGYGTQGGDCKYIIFKYYASESAKKENIISTQILRPDSTDSFGADVTKPSTFANNRYAFYNSKNATYWLNYYNTSYTVSDGGTVTKNFDKYLETAKEFMVYPENITYSAISEKINAPSLKGGSTDYIRFRLEYGFYELYEIGFYCDVEGQSPAKFNLNYWALYRYGLSDNTSIDNGETRIENFAFVSDTVSMSFSGTKLYESMLDGDGVSDGADAEVNRAVAAKNIDQISRNRSGSVTYVFKNYQTLTKTLLPNYNTAVYPETQASSTNAFFFRSCAADAQTSNTVSLANRAIYNFSVQFSNQLGAGIEAYYTDPYTGKVSYTECLEAEIEYLDGNGNKQVITVPVITNALLEWVYPVNEDLNSETAKSRLEKLKNGGYVSYGVDGDALNFSVEFPSISVLKSVTLNYTPITDDDFITIDYIAVYDNAGETRYARRDLYVNNAIEDAAISTHMTGATLLYVSKERRLTMNSHIDETDFEMVKADSSTDISQAEKKLNDDTLYLITLKTDQNALGVCGTTADILASFSYYDYNGVLRKTAEYDLRQASAEFYGANPVVKEIKTPQVYSDGAIKKNADGSVAYTISTAAIEGGQYYYGMAEGGTLKFYINAKNVSKFVGAQFRLADDVSEDDWQLKSMVISKVGDGAVEGRRYVIKINKTFQLETFDGTLQTVYLNRAYDKTVTALTEYYRNDDIGYMATRNQAMVLNFENDIIEEDDSKKDYSDYKYSMTVDQSAQDLGLNAARAHFDVYVHVGKNSENATRDDDCGSDNLFYFQLLFESAGATHSTSGYVLANQQLTADGFRAGETEVFSIYCNEYVGNVVGVNIIPDNQTDDAKIMDKLYITQIEVIRSETSKVDKRFVCENVGWVEHEYEDDDSNTTQKGKTAADLVFTAPVSGMGYVMNLEFRFGIGAYQTSGTETTASRFMGGLKMDLQYEDANEYVSGLNGIDIIKAMCEYADKTPVIDSDLGAATTRDNQDETASDYAKWMLKGDTSCNFLVKTSDMCLLKSISIYGMPYSSTKANSINLESISVFCVVSKGDWALTTTDNGYDRKAANNGKVLLSSEVSPALSNLTFAASNSGYYVPQTYNFEDPQVLPQIENEKSLLSMVGREPATKNDTFNVYIYMDETSPSQEKGNYKLQADIYYTSVIGQGDYQVRVSTMKEKTVELDGKEVNCIYETGITATNFLALKNMTIAAPAIFGSQMARQVKVQYAIIQQVRSGVVINTYKIQFGGTMVALTKGGLSALGKTPAKELGSKQVVTIQLGQDTAKTNLIAEKFDIAVAIRYKSTATNDDKIYTSTNVFVTDDGVTNIHAGSILDFEFNEPYVKEIVGIDVQCVDTLSQSDIVANFQCANVKCYETNAKNELTQVSVSSINEPAALGQFAAHLDVTSAGEGYVTVLKRVDITFKTSEIIDVVDSAGTAPIRMKLIYTKTDSTESNGEIDIPDIRQFASNDDAGFGAGQSVTVSLFAPDAKKLRYIILDPYFEDSDALAIWNLGSITFSLEGADDDLSHTVNVEKTLYQNGNEHINLSAITVKLAVKNGERDEGSVINDTMYITADIGSEITVTPTVYDSNQGYRVNIYRQIGLAKAPIESFGKDGGSFTHLASNDTASDVTWVIEVASAESATVKSVINVQVPPQGSGTGTVKKSDDSSTSSGGITGGETTSGSGIETSSGAIE